MERSSTIRLLAGIALVLFCLNFFTFASRTFDVEFSKGGCGMAYVHVRPMWKSAPQPSPFYIFKPEHAAAQRYWLRSQWQRRFITRAPATPINEELRIRAAQPSEADDALRNKLGLTGPTTIHIPVMR